MEAVLERELRTFESVTGAEIEDMACTADPPQGNAARVACTGRIVALYGTEETTFPSPPTAPCRKTASGSGAARRSKGLLRKRLFSRENLLAVLLVPAGDPPAHRRHRQRPAMDLSGILAADSSWPGPSCGC
jgi:hypothetical protein